jgi:hypothetical protein
VRTTINLDDALLANARRIAAETGRSLTVVVEEAVRESLGRRVAPPTERRPLPLFRGDGLQPGVDLDDAADLLDLMDDDATV